MSKANKRTPRRIKPQWQMQISEVCTGIYVQSTMQPVRNPRDMETFMREYADRHNRLRREWLSHVEQAVRNIIDAGDSPKLIAQDARQALTLCKATRHCIEQGNDAVTAFEAFQLGLVVARIGVRPFEPLVIDGQSVRRTTSRGGKSRSAKYASQRLEYQPEIDRLVLECGNNYSSACKNAARRFGVVKRTIERHTKKPRQC